MNASYIQKKEKRKTYCNKTSNYPSYLRTKEFVNSDISQ